MELGREAAGELEEAFVPEGPVVEDLEEDMELMLRELRRGGFAFRVAPRAAARRLERFDPEADQIVTVPRVVGG